MDNISFLPGGTEKKWMAETNYSQYPQMSGHYGKIVITLENPVCTSQSDFILDRENKRFLSGSYQLLDVNDKGGISLGMILIYVIIYSFFIIVGIVYLVIMLITRLIKTKNDGSMRRI